MYIFTITTSTTSIICWTSSLDCWYWYWYWNTQRDSSRIHSLIITYTNTNNKNHKLTGPAHSVPSHPPSSLITIIIIIIINISIIYNTSFFLTMTSCRDVTLCKYPTSLMISSVYDGDYTILQSVFECPTLPPVLTLQEKMPTYTLFFYKKLLYKKLVLGS